VTAHTLDVPATVEELSAVIADAESDRKGVPVLLKQYLRLGARIIAFTVDHDFGHTLDALVIVDLRQTEASLLERYMSKAGAAAFRAQHGLDGAELAMSG
jgi:putative hemolysin